MPIRNWKLIAAGMVLFTQAAIGQNVKLAGIGLGMTEAEVKTALTASAPFYVNQPSAYPDMQYLVAETESESLAFTLIDGKVAAFSVVHFLPPGQLPFLPQGQQPTVPILRGLITRQTWDPAAINKGDTLWLSDANGAPLTSASQCAPISGTAWLPFGPVPGAKPGEPAVRSTVDLLKPSSSMYPSNCGVSMHLNETPAESDESVVTSVRYQVLDIKGMNAFLARHKQQ